MPRPLIDTDIPDSLYADLQLDPKIQPAAPIADHWQNPESLFLTGATGFLGAYLVQGLMARTQATIYYLSRQKTIQEANERLVQQLHSYQVWQEEYRPRLVPVLGDLAQPRDPNRSNIVQAHLLLPPPPPGHRTALLVCPLTFSKDGASNHILRDRLPPHIDIMSDHVQTTLLQHLIGGGVNPLVINPPAWRVFLRHPICHTDFESLESGHDSWAQDPRLASVQEDRLHNNLVAKYS